MLVAAFERALERAGLGPTDRVLVACSGGLDSVVLLDLCLERLGAPRVVVAHVDHAVRPGSAHDADFVAALAAREGVEAWSVRLPAGPSDEARLRRLRYRALESARRALGADWILTAHHRGDQAESVLIGLLRSARPSALRGIPERRGRVLRPLLAVPRAELLARAERRGLAWREDPTNREPRQLRSRIRKELLPLLESRYRPGMEARLARLAARLSTPDRSASALARGASTPTAPRPGSASGPATSLPAEGPELRIDRRAWPPEGLPLGDGRRRAVFDAAVLGSPRLRPARSADRVQPFGMLGHRKLQDVWVDAKLPPAARARWLVLCDAAGTVAWVPGLLRSALAPVGPTTEVVWVCELVAPAACPGAPDGPV